MLVRFSSHVSSRLPLYLLLSALLCAGVFGAGLLYAQSDGSKTVGKTKPSVTAIPNSSMKKYALVLGNTSYQQKPLKNPKHDVADMAAALRKLGFEVIIGHDLDYQQMTQKVAEFSTAIKNRGPNDIALFYYSGHGLQYQGKNYLVPLDAEETAEENIDLNMLGVDRILGVLGSEKHGGNIVILDACRNNPYGGKGTKGEGMRGLAATSRRSNTLIAYATDADKTASDNEKERNGLYTGELLKNLAKPDLSILDIFMATRVSVLEKSGNTQEPWELSSLHRDFILLGTPAPDVATALTSSVSSSVSSSISSTSPPEVWITLPSGSFMMGCVNADKDCIDNPEYEVQDENFERKMVSRRHEEYVPSFQLMRTEVTVMMYQKCVEAGKCLASDESTKLDCNWGRSDRRNHPMNCVSYDQADKYCEYVGGRLPSEMEWEYAARSAGKEQIYPWGNEAASCLYAVMNDGGEGCGRKLTWPVCSKPRGNSAQGICDLSGNVREWISDLFSCGDGGVQGGAWRGDPTYLRSFSGQLHGYMEGSDPDIGFRCAR